MKLLQSCCAGYDGDGDEVSSPEFYTTCLALSALEHQQKSVSVSVKQVDVKRLSSVSVAISVLLCRSAVCDTIFH